MFDKNPDEIYLIKDCLQNENVVSCGHYKSDTLNKLVKIPVANLSENFDRHKHVLDIKDENTLVFIKVTKKMEIQKFMLKRNV